MKKDVKSNPPAEIQTSLEMGYAFTTDSGWKIANTALLFIVLSEALRGALTVRGYRTPRPAH